MTNISTQGKESASPIISTLGLNFCQITYNLSKYANADQTIPL